MTDNSFCDREMQVWTALESGALPADLATHAAECAVCGDASVLRAFFAAAQTTDGAEDALPSPHLIWWRWQLAEKRAQADRSLAPIRMAQKAALVLAAAFCVLFAVVRGPQMAAQNGLMFLAVLAGPLLIVLTAGVTESALRRTRRGF